MVAKVRWYVQLPIHGRSIVGLPERLLKEFTLATHRFFYPFGTNRVCKYNSANIIRIINSPKIQNVNVRFLPFFLNINLI